MPKELKLFTQKDIGEQLAKIFRKKMINYSREYIK